MDTDFTVWSRGPTHAKYQLNSLDFSSIDFFMQLFNTSNIRIVQLCQELLHFDLPSVQLARRRKVFLDKFCV